MLSGLSCIKRSGGRLVDFVSGDVAPGTERTLRGAYFPLGFKISPGVPAPVFMADISSHENLELQAATPLQTPLDWPGSSHVLSNHLRQFLSVERVRPQVTGVLEGVRGNLSVLEGQRNEKKSDKPKVKPERPEEISLREWGDLGSKSEVGLERATD